MGLSVDVGDTVTASGLVRNSAFGFKMLPTISGALALQGYTREENKSQKMH